MRCKNFRTLFSKALSQRHGMGQGQYKNISGNGCCPSPPTPNALDYLVSSSRLAVTNTKTIQIVHCHKLFKLFRCNAVCLSYFVNSKPCVCKVVQNICFRKATTEPMKTTSLKSRTQSPRQALILSDNMQAR